MSAFPSTSSPPSDITLCDVAPFTNVTQIRNIVPPSLCVPDLIVTFHSLSDSMARCIDLPVFKQLSGRLYWATNTSFECASLSKTRKRMTARSGQLIKKFIAVFHIGWKPARYKFVLQVVYRNTLPTDLTWHQFILNNFIIIVGQVQAKYFDLENISILTYSIY